MMRIVLLVFIVVCGNMSAQSLFPKNPFTDVIAVHYADSMTRAKLKELTLEEKCKEIAGPKNFVALNMKTLFAGKGMAITPIGGNSKSGIPSVYFTDGPRGVIVGKDKTGFPVPMARAATWNVALEQKIGMAIADEVREEGAGLIGTPCMNLLRHPANGRAQEVFGEDPYLVGQMALHLMQGIQSRGVMATAKHFALNSLENSRYTVNVKIDERTLQEVYLPHFKLCIDNGVASVMSAYNKVNGQYCGENNHLLNDVLRKQWGFRGFVHSDWEKGVYSTAPSIKAGMNVEMMIPKFYKYSVVNKAIQSGDLTLAQIDSLIYPTLFTKFLFDYQQHHIRIKDASDHRKLAYQAAAESAVLLKNENHFLPLQHDKVKTIAIVGSLLESQNEGDHGSSYVRNKHYTSLLTAFTTYAKENHITLLHDDGRNVKRLQSICKKADVVVVIAGYRFDEEGEYVSRTGKPRKDPYKRPYGVFGTIGVGGDRPSLSLKQRDIDLLNNVTRITKSVVVNLIGGSAITMEEWKDKVPAIMMNWYYGCEGAKTIPQLLFGEINPSGKLPFTIPVSEKDLPDFPLKADSITYGYYHGYTLLDKKQIKPAFPFGFGLNYADIEIGEGKVTNRFQLHEADTIHIECEVTNTSDISGIEVVQLYIGCENTQVDHPIKLLRSFMKLEFRSKESMFAFFRLPVKELAYYDEKTKSWKVAKGDYKAWVTNSSDVSNTNPITFSIR
jgi:beta-glucosidase